MTANIVLSAEDFQNLVAGKVVEHRMGNAAWRLTLSVKIILSDIGFDRMFRAIEGAAFPEYRANGKAAESERP